MTAPVLVVRVDVVVLALEVGDDGSPGPLVLLLQRLPPAAAGPESAAGSGTAAARWALPGDRLGPEEDLQDAALRVVAGTVGRVRHLEQLASFGRPDRDPGARVVSVTYLGLLPRPVAVGADLGWHRLDAAPPLASDHAEIAAAGVERLRAKLSYSTVAYGLLPGTFTLSELQAVYEAVVGRPLDKRNFRKKVLALGVVEATEGQRRGSHRPAQLHRFAREELVLLDDVIPT